MINFEEPITFNGQEFTKRVGYFVTDNGSDLNWIGYIDILDGEKVVFHANLTHRRYDELSSKSQEEIEKIVTDEVNVILSGSDVSKRIAFYQDAISKGYYQEYNFVAPIPQDDFQTMKDYLLKSMDNMCTQKIEQGFNSDATGENHFYRFDLKQDQLNFTQQLAVLDYNQNITTIYWKTEDAGVLLHTREQFYKVALVDAQAHKLGNINRYWSIKAKILSATTMEELNTISWDMAL